MITALRMLAEGTLNPGWFGHPGTTTITLVALIDVVIAGWAVSGHYATLMTFHAGLCHPALLFPRGSQCPAWHNLRVVTFALGKRWHCDRPDRRVAVRSTRCIRLVAGHPHRHPRQRVYAGVPVFSLILSAGVTPLSARRCVCGPATATKCPPPRVIAVSGVRLRPVARERADDRTWCWCRRGLDCWQCPSRGFSSRWPMLSNVSGEVKRGTSANAAVPRNWPISRRACGRSIEGRLCSPWWRRSIGRTVPVARWTYPAACCSRLISPEPIWSRWVAAGDAEICIFVWSRGLARRPHARRRSGPGTVALGVLAIARSAVAQGAMPSKPRLHDTRSQAACLATRISARSRVVFELSNSARDRPWQILFPIAMPAASTATRAQRWLRV